MVDEVSFGPARELFEEIISWLSSDTACGLSHSDLEEMLRVNGTELLRRLLQGYLDGRASDEIEGPCLGSDGVVRTHKRQQSRKLMTLFGEVSVNRVGYGGRGTASLHPLDAELNLPPELYSHGVRLRVAQEIALNSFDETVTALLQTTGATVPKRQVEELTSRAAVDFDAFYQRRETSHQIRASKTGEILVISVDGKGVTMRQSDLRETTRKRAEKSSHRLAKRLSKGEKRNAKRMATVAAVYTIQSWVRTPQDIVPDSPPVSPTLAKRPRPESKRIWASLVKDPAQVIEEAFLEALRRDPQRQKHWVALVDGNEAQLRLLKKCAQKYQVQLTIVLDVIHVIEYLWKAAFVFHQSGTQQAEEWVSSRLLKVLEGDSSLVAAGMRRSATLRQIEADKRSAVDKCANYLLNHTNFLHYQHYLKAGFPIATGVIEGACRYLVKDRMELTGARWSLNGAEAVLCLRALHASGDFEEYWRFHLECERQRNHCSLYKTDIPLMQRLICAQCSTPPQLDIVV